MTFNYPYTFFVRSKSVNAQMCFYTILCRMVIQQKKNRKLIQIECYFHNFLSKSALHKYHPRTVFKNGSENSNISV